MLSALVQRFLDDRGTSVGIKSIVYFEVRRCEIPFEGDGPISDDQRLEWIGRAKDEQISEPKRIEILQYVRQELRKAGYYKASKTTLKEP